MNREKFVVDASLLIELGERLIGRPAIALGELVKNSFDADASICQIQFGADKIIVSDNGTGMSEADFLKYWMRIGTTHKVDQQTSLKHHRPLTGSKGIGRLSAQFLADEIVLESTSSDEPSECLYALVDWRNAVRGKNLSEVSVEWQVRSDSPQYPRDSFSGTRITLTGLKSVWSAEDIGALGDEVWTLRSPFKRPAISATAQSEEFEIEIDAPDIKGGRDAFEKNLRMVLSNWKARIRGSLEDGASNGEGIVLVEFREDYPDGSPKAHRFKETVQLPVQTPNEVERPPFVDNVSFEILIFKPEGRQPGGISVTELRAYLAKFGNVSVYDAGFRLPYYGSGRDKAGQDWLLIATDQGRRLNASELLPDHLKTQNKYLQDLPAPGRIFGAVEINTNHEREVALKIKQRGREWLQIQPGRDRLHDNKAFTQLRNFVRLSLDLYANRHRVLALEVSEKNRVKEPASTKYDRAIDLLERAKKEIPPVVLRDVKRELLDARKAAAASEHVQVERTALLAPLASAGMVALALNHEIGREGRFLKRIGNELRRLATKHSLKGLKEIAAEFDEAKQRLDSIRDLFAPLLSETDRAATDRLKVRIVADQVVEAMRYLMPGVKFSTSAIPSDLRFPLGSLSEWNALLQNVLSNAWNALLDSKRAEISFMGGKESNGREWLRISDTGQGLDIPLSDSNQLFEPFERRIRISDDKRSIAIGGQGLGLAIVRMIAARRSTDVSFTEPAKGFSTTFEISWRGARK